MLYIYSLFFFYSLLIPKNLGFPSSTEGPVNYSGARVYRLDTKTKQQQEFLSEFLNEYGPSVSVWSTGLASLDVMLPASVSDEILPFDAELLIEDVGLLIKKEKHHSILQSTKLNQSLSLDPLSENVIFSDYQDYTTIVQFMSSLPGVESISLGKTFLKNEIMGFKLGTGSKQIVFHGKPRATLLFFVFFLKKN